MIKPEHIKQVETTRESIVRDTVYVIVDSIILEETQSYNGVEHIARIPYNWEGFSTYDSYDIENTLAILEYDIEPIVKEYLEEFVKQEGIYDGSFYSEDGEFMLEYKVR